MKRFFVLFSIAALFAFSACDKKQGENPGGQDTGSITISAAQLNQTIGAAATAAGIAFSTEAAWTAKLQGTAAWIVSIDPDGGDKGSHNIEVETAANTTTAPRSAVIVITSGNDSARVTITQSGTGGGGGGDNEYVITATNVNTKYESDGDVAEIAAIWYPQTSQSEEQGTTIAVGAYGNHGFTLTLPALEDNKLELLSTDMPDGITLSDDTAKMGFISFLGFDADGERLYFFGYMSNDEDHAAEVEYAYLDKDVTVTGSYVDEYDTTIVYNAQFKKGWNMYYMYEDNEGGYYTTTAPAGYTFQWYYGY